MSEVQTGNVVIVVKASLAQFKQDMTDGTGVATRETKKMSSEIKAQVNEARGSMMLLGEEIGVHIPRHLQAVIAKLPGVGAAFSAAFNAVAVLAIIEVIVKIVEKINAAREAAAKAAEGWAKLEAETRAHADALRLSNIQLENQIAKLNNKPENHVKEALAESIVEADKLADSLQKDIAQIEKMFKEQHIGFWSQLFGSAGGDDVEKQVAGTHATLTKITDEFNEKIRTTTDAKEREKVAIEASQAAQKSYGDTLTFLNTELDKANKLQQQRDDNSKKVTSFDRFGNERHESAIPDDQSKRIVLLKNALRELRNEADVTGLSFQGFNLHIEKAMADDAAAVRKFGEEITKIRGAVTNLFDKFRTVTESPFEKLRREADTAEQQIRQMAKDNPHLFKRAFPYDSVDTVVQSMRNLALAAEDTELQKSLEEINKLLIEINKAAQLPKDLFAGLKPTLPSLAADAKGKTSGQKELEQITQGTEASAKAAEAAAQKIRDAVETDNEKYQEQLLILKQLHDAHLLTDKEYRDAQKQLSGQAAAWKQLGADIGTTIEQAALFGRSWTDALKAILIELVKVILKLSLMKELQASSGAGGVGGFFSSILSGLIGGAKAGGGPVEPGKGYWVGEKGPEWFSPGSSGTIVPNGAGGGSSTVYNIDARGADVAAIARLERMIQSSKMEAVSISVATMRDQERRR